MNIEPELVEEVLDQVSAGRIDPSITGVGAVEGASRATRIETPYLQLVMQRLWDVERGRGSQVMRLETFHALGGAERIVQDHLERALHTLSPAEQAAAASMFGHLVTPSGTKIAHGTSDLANYASLGEGEIRPVLDTLARQRILRPVGGENGHAGDRYEIFHDVLAGAVLAWRTRHEADAALEQERRRRKRFGWIAAVALIGLAVMAALAAFAWSQRQEARKQSAEVKKQSAEAESQRQAALTLAGERRRAVILARRASRLAEKRRLAALEQKVTAQRATENALIQKRRADNLAQQARIQKERAIEGKTAAQASARAAREAQAAAVAGAKEARAARAEAREEATRAKIANDKAQAAAKRARARADIARSLRLVGRDPQASAAAALQASAFAAKPSDRVEAENALRAALVALSVQHILPGGGQSGSTLSSLSTEPRAAEVAHFSGDGRRAVVGVGGNSATVRVFRIRDGKLLKTFTAGAPVNDVAINRDGKFVAAAGQDGRVWVWNVDAPGVRQFDHGTPVSAVVWSPTADILASVGGKNARLWDLATGATRSLLPQSHDLHATVFSRDGQRVATYGEGHFVRIFDVDTGIRIDTVAYPVSGLPVTSAAFGRQSNVLVTGRGNQARVWNLDTNGFQTLTGQTGAVTDVAVSENGERVATASADTVARVFFAATGVPDDTYYGHTGLGITDIDFSPERNSNSIVTAGTDHTARFFSKGQNMVTMLGHTRALLGASFSPDGRTVLTSSKDGTARLFDPYLEPVPTVVADYGSRGAVTSVAVDPSGSLLAVGGKDGAVHVLSPDGDVVRVPLERGPAVVSVAWARGQKLLAATQDGKLRIWGNAGASAPHVFDHGSRVNAAAISRDGKLAVTAGENGDVREWRLAAGGFLTFPHDGPVNAVAFDPGGKLLATASGTAVYTWRTSGGHALHTFEPEDADPGKDVTGVAFKDDSLLATSSEDSHLRTWSVRSGQLRKTFLRHGSAVQGVAFDPDGRWFASVAARKGAIWQVGDSGLDGNFLLFVARPLEEQNNLTSVAFSTNHRVVMGDSGGRVLSYECRLCGKLPQLRKIASDKLERLSREARR